MNAAGTSVTGIWPSKRHTTTHNAVTDSARLSTNRHNRIIEAKSVYQKPATGALCASGQEKGPSYCPGPWSECFAGYTSL